MSNCNCVNSDIENTENSENTNSDYSNNKIMLNTNSENIQEGELDNLIQILRGKLATNDYKIQTVKYPNLLIMSLMELRDLVGMNRLKDSIALQVMRLIDAANNKEKSSKMLNSILYGPPGVGKTKVGIILSKIWYSLGYLESPSENNSSENSSKNSDSGDNRNRSSNSSDSNNNSSDDPNKNINKIITTYGKENPGINPFVWILLLFLFYSFTYIISGAKYVYNSVGMKWFGIILFVLVILCFILYNNKTSYNYITTVVKNEPDHHNKRIPKFDDKNIKTLRKLNDRDLITVVSRQDFVAEYVGQTATKTKALLYRNMGKVLFIDEAYSLINGPRDPFGMEALTTLNLFLSEHPNSIAIIFAGYKDLMKNGIFKFQPGLPRRCMWHFECEKYDGDQLANIFFRQIHKEGWKVRKPDINKIKQLICDNEELFTSYGGDTERLFFFSQLEASRDNILSDSSYRSDIYVPTNSNISNSNRIDSSNSYGHISNDSCQNINCSSRSDLYELSNQTNMENSRIVLGKTITYEHVCYGLKRLKDNDIDRN